MTDTTVLYTLSTLAQTCAALAGLLGGVGGIRLQNLQARRKEAEDTFRLYYYAQQQPAGGWGTPVGYGPIPGPRDQIIAMIEALGSNHPAVDALSYWRTLGPPLRRSLVALFIFEGVELGVIGASLIGFNYIEALTCARWTFWGLWGVAAVVVGVTASYVWTWTLDVEQ